MASIILSILWILVQLISKEPVQYYSPPSQMGKLRHREASESQDLNPVGLAPEAAVRTSRLNCSSLEILPAGSCRTNLCVSKLEKNISLYTQFKIF